MMMMIVSAFLEYPRLCLAHAGLFSSGKDHGSSSLALEVVSTSWAEVGAFGFQTEYYKTCVWCNRIEPQELDFN